MAQDRIAEQVAGVVTCSNPKGFQLAGRDGWLNVSKFAVGVEVPAKGQNVVAGLDKAGFVREVEIVTAQPTRDAATEIAPGRPDYNADRQAVITRSACLNTATAILSSGSRPTDAVAVLALAEQLERWCWR